MTARFPTDLAMSHITLTVDDLAALGTSEVPEQGLPLINALRLLRLAPPVGYQFPRIGSLLLPGGQHCRDQPPHPEVQFLFQRRLFVEEGRELPEPTFRDRGLRLFHILPTLPGQTGPQPLAWGGH